MRCIMIQPGQYLRVRIATLNLAKHGMLSIEPRARRKRYKKLGAVCIRAGIGH